MKVFWPLTITNEALLQKTKLSSIENEIKLRRWRLTGHFLRMDQSEIPLTALTWSPEGRRKRGRPRLTWRRMMESERDEAGWSSWAEARAAARDRRAWSKRLRALCAPEHEKT
ncbi:endonuclease-reverse transcriptase [Lasius niger]|uniref:Endonuclease-reverse transcriptase n=1 Tax=Lasius niger TaxID=67767 RepID=A0A0J7MLX8_LASNI|nr:endonuclease-reverse transcriptase [Lasius niger]